MLARPKRGARRVCPRRCSGLGSYTGRCGPIVHALLTDLTCWIPAPRAHTRPGHLRPRKVVLMLGRTHAVQVWARPQPTDLRLGFRGLAAMVQAEFHRQVHDGDLFLFVNRRRTSTKILLWDGTGLCIYSKKLAPGRGRFAQLWDGSVGGKPLRLTPAELNLFLERPVASRGAK